MPGRPGIAPPPRPALTMPQATDYVGRNFNQPITVDRSCYSITDMHNDSIHLKARWTIKYMLKY